MLAAIVVEKHIVVNLRLDILERQVVTVGVEITTDVGHLLQDGGWRQRVDRLHITTVGTEHQIGRTVDAVAQEQALPQLDVMLPDGIGHAHTPVTANLRHILRADIHHWLVVDIDDA